MTGEVPPDDLRLGDGDRLHALNVLAEHYAAGRLSTDEFYDRSGEIAVARTLGAASEPFRGLPGGVPLENVDGRVRVVAAEPEALPAIPAGSAEAELTTLRSRGALVESLDWLIIGATLVAFLVLQLVVDWDYAWLVWPSLIVTLSIPRVVLRFSDADEEIYEELKESDAAARKKRLGMAAERIRELGTGSDQDRS
ncbi:DUF1707 SHOCT-like domain-containing protein [Nocardia flavorosea]|uniref:DUF1707 domain-containing protein n=1 Tax=Nocardia flavorosea TaxID=53429 RepID=A0A846Y5J2_9NOCA|nr:DUF1707 domain-containing protein [Nocardia flavorosea]NKY54796.1 DUF1707 domain-containing protein [Nocardia flavorosea]